MKNPRTLRNRIAIQEPHSTSRDSNGEPLVDWTNVLWPVSASARALTGRELFAAQEHHSEIKVVFVMRYRADVTADMRVVWDLRSFEILYIDDITRRHVGEMSVYCAEGVVFERDGSPQLLLESGGTVLLEGGGSLLVE